MSLDRALSDTVRSVPDCVAAGFVDMTTGTLLGVKTTDSHPQEALDMVAAATGDMFLGPNVVTIEKLFRKARGLPDETDEHFFEECMVLSKDLIHIFVRGRKHRGKQVLIVVTRAHANVGMVLSKARRSLEQVESAAA